MKNNTYILLCIIALVAIGSYYFYNKNTSPSSSNNDTLTIGTATGYAPWVSINQHGEYEGFDIDVMHAIANQMQKKLIIKDLGSMSSLFIALEQQKVDAIMWAISITQDRLNKVAMIHYHGDATTSYPLLFWERIPEGITTINDMTDNTVSVEPTSSQDTVLSKYSFINKLATEKVDDALLNIQYGKANAALVEPSIAQKFKQKFPQIQILDVPLAAEDQVAGVGICINKTNANLIEQVTAAVQTLTENGTIKQLEEKWAIV
ncbi:MAG TPA: transporter substrate-binding domain-containing protein [Candidatus Babeliales bacterium]|nr:transporter substrate-binding domain-containing protein [Candidatus Babeliales bacterium]